MARSSVFSSVQHRVLGVTFLLLLALFGYLTYAIFNKSFVSYDDVTLQTSKAGLQLPDRADVKIRGVRVGEVTGATVVGGPRRPHARPLPEPARHHPGERVGADLAEDVVR